MFKKISLMGAAVAMGAATLVPAAPAAAQRYDGYYGQRYDNGYYGDRYYRDNRNYRQNYRNYRNYRGQDRYYRDRRCDNGTTGTIVGAIAGGLLGNAVVGRRGDRTVGTIIGGAAGALAGRAIDKGDNPRYCR